MLQTMCRGRARRQKGRNGSWREPPPPPGKASEGDRRETEYTESGRGILVRCGSAEVDDFVIASAAGALRQRLDGGAFALDDHPRAGRAAQVDAAEQAADELTVHLLVLKGRRVGVGHQG